MSILKFSTNNPACSSVKLRCLSTTCMNSSFKMNPFKYVSLLRSASRNFSYFFTFNVASMILGVGEGHRYDNERLHAIAYFAAWGTSVTVSHLVFCPIDTLRRQLVLQEVLNYQDKRNGRVFNDGVFDTAMKMWHSGGIAQSYHNLRTSVPAALLSYVLIAASFRIQRLLFSRQS